MFTHDPAGADMILPQVPEQVPLAQFESDVAHELGLIVQSGNRLIYVQTDEPQRAEAITAQVAMQLKLPMMHWTCVNGLGSWDDIKTHPNTLEAAVALETLTAIEGRFVCVMHELSSAERQPQIESLLRELGSGNFATIVIVEHDPHVPQALRPISARFHLKRPDAARIDHHVRMRLSELSARGWRSDLTPSDIEQLGSAMRGLTLDEIDRLIPRLAVEDGVVDANDIPTASKLRTELIAQSGTVTLEYPTLGMDWVAGFTHVKQWSATRRPVLDERAIAFGLEPARGILLTGVPGCGKSFAVKALAATWDLPLLRLDAGSLYAKYIGETESNLRQAFEVAESLAPSLLWIDEVEKGFASTTGETDGGVTQRVLGALLTWMQERQSPVFLAATSNDVSVLPPEFTRKGRFDEIFFVDLPTLEDRAHLFALQINLRRRDYRTFDCNALAAASEGFSGAEIEQAVASAMYDAYAASSDVTTDFIMRQITATVPLSRSAPERVRRIRDWGAEHARPA